MVIMILSVLSLDNSWLLVLSRVGRRAAGAAAAGVGAAVVVVAAMELVVDLVLDLLLQVVESAMLLLLALLLLKLLGIVHLGAGALLRVCVVLALVLGWVNVLLGDVLLSGLYNSVVLVSRGVGRRENRERDRNSSVEVQIEGLQKRRARIESFKLFR